MGAATTQLGPGPAVASDEASALSKVMWFAIIQLVGLVATWVASYFVFVSVFSNSALFNLGPNASGEQVSAALGPLFQTIWYLIPLGIGIGLVGLIFLTLGFRGLSKVDPGRFSTSTAFMVVLMVGLLMIAVGASYILNGIPGMLANIPAQGTPTNAFFTQMGSLAAGLGLLAIGGLIGLIGLIGGLILGLWRVGSRYNQTIVKVGAICEVIPLLNLVAPILILIGVNEAKGALAR